MYYVLLITLTCTSNSRAPGGANAHFKLEVNLSSYRAKKGEEEEGVTCHLQDSTRRLTWLRTDSLTNIKICVLSSRIIRVYVM